MATLALSWLGSAILKMFYLVSPWDLALDDSDPSPQYLLRQGIPMFFVFIVAEAAFVAARRRAGSTKPLPRYRLNDTLACIMLGSLQRLGGLVLELIGPPRMSRPTAGYTSTPASSSTRQRRIRCSRT